MATRGKKVLTKRVSDRLGWKDRFLETLKGSGNVRHACQAAGIDRGTAYDHRRLNEKFRLAWDDAIDDANDVVELELRRRGVQGVEKIRAIRVGTDAKGRPIYERFTEREYDTVAAIFILKGERPEKFRDNYDWKAIFAGFTATQAGAIANSGETPRPSGGKRRGKR